MLKSNKKLAYPILTAMLSALAFVLYLFEFPLFMFPHLRLDLSDIPALVAGVVLGPVYGVIVELIKNLIEMITRGLGAQMGFGNIMNFLVGCAYILPFSFLFRFFQKKEKEYGFSVVVSAVAGIATIVIVGVGANYFITPIFFRMFMGMELSYTSLWAAIWSATALNAVKGAMLSVAAIILLRFTIDAIKKVLKY